MKRTLSLLKQDSGQSIVEFALVLPVLILITIGTIYLTISFTHKSRMNGLAFMTARSAAVQPTEKKESTETFVKERYSKQSKQSLNGGWLGRLESTTQDKGKRVEVIMKLASNPTDDQGDMWVLLANVIDIIGGKGSYSPKKIIAKASLFRENKALSLKARSDTSTVVDYSFSGSLGLGGLLPIEIPLDKFGFVQMADRFNGDLAKKKKALGLQPPNEKISEFYQYVDWLKKSQDIYDFNNDEEEDGQMEYAKTIGDYFKTIELTGGILNGLSAINPFVKEIKDILGGAADQVAQKIESSLNKTASQVGDLNKDYL